MGEEGKMSHYSITKLEEMGIKTGRHLIDWCKSKRVPDDLNWVLFSTSGVHGTYTSLDDIEFDSEPPTDITCLLIFPRLVRLTYGIINLDRDDVPELREICKESLVCIQDSQSGNV